MSGCSHDDLLGLARGDLPPDRAEEVEAHTAECAACARELAWLRTERALFRAQMAAPASHVWQAIERRIVIAREERRVRRQRWLHVGSAGTIVAAAAAFAVFLWSHGMRELGGSAPTAASSQTARPEAPEPETQPAAARQALDAAEVEYRDAIRRLEQAYASEREHMDPEDAARYDDELRRIRDELQTERAAARDDIWARRQVLHTYSAYMRTMQAMVLEGRK